MYCSPIKSCPPAKTNKQKTKKKERKMSLGARSCEHRGSSVTVVCQWVKNPSWTVPCELVHGSDARAIKWRKIQVIFFTQHFSTLSISKLGELLVQFLQIHSDFSFWYQKKISNTAQPVWELVRYLCVCVFVCSPNLILKISSTRSQKVCIIAYACQGNSQNMSSICYSDSSTCNCYLLIPIC